MVLFWLYIKADLENVTELKYAEDIRWHIKWKCNNCGTLTDKHVPICAQEEVEKGRGKAHLAVKCKFCARENTAEIVTPKTLKTYNDSDSGKFKSLIAFECRGISPEEFQPSKGWECKGETTDSTFEVDLSDDWADYDDDGECSVGIFGCVGKFERTEKE